MDEISDSPLWDRSPGRTGGIGLEDLDLSDSLRQQLREWNDSRHSWPPEGPRPWSEAEWAKWRRTGRNLAHYLQNELWDVEILYFDETGEMVPVRPSG